jgi:hypothetical protein
MPRLSAGFGVSGTAVALFISKKPIAGCTFWKTNSSLSMLNCPSGVSQGLMLDPIIFSKLVSPVYHIAQAYTISHQQYADDILLYIAVSASQPRSGIHRLEQYLLPLYWCFSNERSLTQRFQIEVHIFLY